MPLCISLFYSIELLKCAKYVYVNHKEFFFYCLIRGERVKTWYIIMCKNHSRQLEENTSMSELENALWSFKTNTSPREYGVPIEWYRPIWYLIKHGFLNIMSDILDLRRLTYSQYKGFITLIYKNGDSELLKHWRPITLLNCDYKL